MQTLINSADMSAFIDLTVILGVLIFYCNGYQANHAFFWFAFFYGMGYACSAAVITDSNLSEQLDQ